MFADEDDWPIKCPYCLDEFTLKIGWLKTATRYVCPGCQVDLKNSADRFTSALSEAKDGRLDPWEHMLKIRKSR
jgi:transposase-like protein